MDLSSPYFGTVITNFEDIKVRICCWPANIIEPGQTARTTIDSKYKVKDNLYRFLYKISQLEAIPGADKSLTPESIFDNVLIKNAIRLLITLMPMTWCEF